MKVSRLAHTLRLALRSVPFLFLAVVAIGFGTLSARFLTIRNLAAILNQSSELLVVAVGMNFVLLTAGVDLSVGAAMYLAAIAVGMGLASAPPWVCLGASALVGGLFGGLNGLFV